jgi:Protein kinase domain
MSGRRSEAGEGGPAGNQPGSPGPDGTVSHYRLLGLLGRGGMGIVYRALDEQTGQEVALKLLAAGRRGGDGDRFRREARAAASLDHPNIAKVLEIGEHEGQLFLAMPLYEGETLKKRLDRAEEVAPMPPAEIVSIAAQLASALETAHSAGIIHRDLKPANLMLTRGGRLRLLDFGLALWEGSSRLTDGDKAVGTLAYMAPEQLRGEEVDVRADLWSFGVVLYEMLAGHPPFVRDPRGSLTEMMQTILESQPPPISQVRPDTPAVLERILERCLRKKAGERYTSAAEIIEELRAAALLTDPHPRPDRGGADGMRLWLLLGAGALLVVLLAAIHGISRRTGTIEVWVREPEIQGLPPGETALLASDLGRALRQALREIEGITVLERPRAAREQITAQAYCGPQDCQVVLHRLDAKDGRELWTEHLQVRIAQPAGLVQEMEARLRQAYSPKR